jgi:hypothetical protein
MYLRVTGNAAPTTNKNALGETVPIPTLPFPLGIRFRFTN